MKKHLAAFLLILGPFFVNGQVVTDSLFIEGHYRKFHFHEPKHDTKNASLIFAIHGSGGKALDFMRNAIKLESIAKEEKFILVYPQGYHNYWNECRKASMAEANQININENAFFEKMIEYFETKYRINKNQVFVSGFSGGGHMAYKMGLTMPEKFKAISVMVANMPVPENMDCSEAKMPIAVIIMNGTADQTNPYNGGEVHAGVTLGFVRSTEESFQYWKNLSGYIGEPTKGYLPDADPGNDIIVESYTYKKPNTPEVTLLKIINGVHQFPTDIDMYVETWKFFKHQIEND